MDRRRMFSGYLMKLKEEGKEKGAEGMGGDKGEKREGREEYLQVPMSNTTFMYKMKGV